MDEAASLFEAKRWAEAAAAYQSIVQGEPQNALALIRLARARAANGQAEEALAALRAWFATGSGAYSAAMRLQEFASLRADPRFAAIVEPHKPCNTPQYRQFDFWVGDWDVETPAAPGRVSRNRISRIHDGCTILEQYESPDGYSGSSLNFYDAPRKVWHQTWIDNQGGALYLEGGLEGKAMVLRTVTDALRVQRITWTPLDGGGLRQHWESTTDGGRTWATVFDGYYRPRRAG
jgi:tetratricopeptide (TPR) repeat protein